MKLILIMLALAAAAPPTQVKKSIKLQSLLQRAYKHNPDIQAARRGLDAARAGIDGAGAWSNPRLKASFFLVPIETRVGPQRMNLTLSQRLPISGHLSDRKQAAMALARVASARLDAVARDVLIRVKKAYFELRYLQAAVELLNQDSQLSRRILDMGEAAYGEDELPFYDLTRARVDLARISFDKAVINDLIQREWGRMNALLDRTGYGPPGRIPPLPFPGPALDADALIELAMKNRQELAAADAAIEAAVHRTDQASKAWWPDLEVGLSWFVMQDRGNAADAGKDAWAVGLGMELPLQRNAIRSRIEAAQARVQQAKARRRALAADTRLKIHERLFSARQARRRVNLFRTVLLPQARHALQTEERSSKRSLATLLERKAVLLRFQLAQQRALADYHKALADIEQVLGVPLKVPGEVQ